MQQQLTQIYQDFCNGFFEIHKFISPVAAVCWFPTYDSKKILGLFGTTETKEANKLCIYFTLSDAFIVVTMKTINNLFLFNKRLYLINGSSN